MKSNYKAHLFFGMLFFVIFVTCLIVSRTALTNNAGTVEVYHNGALFGTYSISLDQMIDVNGRMTITISSNHVYVSEAKCPDKQCIKQGKLDKYPIICLPEKIEIRWKHTDADTLDGITH